MASFKHTELWLSFPPAYPQTCAGCQVDNIIAPMTSLDKSITFLFTDNFIDQYRDSWNTVFESTKA